MEMENFSDSDFIFAGKMYAKINSDTQLPEVTTTMAISTFVQIDHK